MTDTQYDRAWTGLLLVTAVLVLAGAFVLAAAPAQAAIDTCALDGPYNTSLEADAPPLVQFLGTFNFHKPGVCTNVGTVDVSGALVSGNTSTPLSAAGLAYTVDAAGLIHIFVGSRERHLGTGGTRRQRRGQELRVHHESRPEPPRWCGGRGGQRGRCDRTTRPAWPAWRRGRDRSHWPDG